MKVEGNFRSSLGSWIGGRWMVDSLQKRHQVKKTKINYHDQEKLTVLVTFFKRNQVWIYLILFAIGLCLRLVGLEERAVHHDESLHGFFAYQLFTGEGYHHNPLMHGMSLFHLLASFFFLFGDNDYTLRLPFALAGSILILVPFLLRDKLGDISSLFVSFFLMISPTMLYFSRFARNDILIALTTVLLIVGIWKYIGSGKNGWLYFIAFFCGIGFTVKENQYIIAFLIVVYFIVTNWRQFHDWVLSRISLSDFNRSADVAVLITLLTIPLSIAFISLFQGPLGLTLAAKDGQPGIATGAPMGAGTYIAIALFIIFLSLSVVFGWFWKKKEFIKIFLFFIIPFILIYTNFGTHPGGAASGVWQSLGYWLAQHDVSRGSQPWYYYLILTSVYEFIPLLLSLLFLAITIVRSTIRTWLIGIFSLTMFTLITLISMTSLNDGFVVIMSILKVLAYVSLIFLTFSLRTTTFNKFLFFFGIASFLAYTVAGEKMPWLTVHIVVPLIFLAGTFTGKVLNRFLTDPITAKSKLYLLLSVFVICWGFWMLIFRDLGTGIELFFKLWFVLTISGLIVLGVWHFSRGLPFLRVLLYLAIGFLFLISPLYIRSSFQLTFSHGDIPKEPMVYTQTSPQVHSFINEIHNISQITNLGYDLPIEIDTRDGFAWPWQWYLRHYTSVSYQDHSDGTGITSDERKVVIINERNRESFLEKSPNHLRENRKIIHRWWFPEETYRNKNIVDLATQLSDKSRVRNLMEFFVYRKMNNRLGTISSFVYFHEDLPNTFN